VFNKGESTEIKAIFLSCPFRKEAITLNLLALLLRKEVFSMNSSTSLAVNKLVVGIDPHKDSLGICITHPDRDEIISSFSIKNCSLLQTRHLIGKAYKLADELGTRPVFVIESTNVFWRPIFSFLKGRGFRSPDSE
jgi:hypothetical protein